MGRGGARGGRAQHPARGDLQAGGPANIPEFGSVKDKQQFNGLLEMDAFHHVEDGVKYPATLLMHGYQRRRACRPGSR